MHQDISVPSLTRRQQQTLDLMCTNYNVPTMCAIMKISVNTLRVHQKALYKLTGVSNRAELIAFAFKHKLVTPNEKGADWVRARAPENDEIDALGRVIYMTIFGAQARPWEAQTYDTKQRFRNAARSAAELRQDQLKGQR